MTWLLVALGGYVVALAALGPRLAATSRRWLRVSPRLGLVAWLTLITSWVITVVSVGLAATAELSGGLGLAGLLRACLRALLTVFGVRDPADTPAALALIGSVLVVTRLAMTAVWHTRRARRSRGRHRRAVCTDTSSVPCGGRRLTVVDTPEPAAYCVAGREPAIVLTTGTVRLLSRDELDAVIAHELAHLRGRHHWFVQWATVLAEAFPFVPLLRAAPPEVARLVEWIADDAASSACGGRAVATALASMATGRSSAREPRISLPAAASGVPERVKRLLQPSSSTRPQWRAAAALVVPLLGLVVAAAVLVPSVTADPTPLCNGTSSISHANDR